MGEHYPMQLTIGGHVDKETLKGFNALLLEAARGLNPLPPIMECFDENNSFYYEDDDCNPATFDELLSFCHHKKLSFLQRCGSNGVESPCIHFWTPDMKEPAWVELTMDGGGYVEDCELKKRLEAYAVSCAERTRGLKELLLPGVPNMPAFEVTDG